MLFFTAAAVPPAIVGYYREVLSLEADISLPALRVTRVLEYLKEFRGLPKMIRVDNGPEFISHVLDEWCRRHEIALTYIQPAKPMQIGYVERCNKLTKSIENRVTGPAFAKHIAVKLGIVLEINHWLSELYNVQALLT